MVLELKANQATANKDGTYNVFVQVIDTVSGKILKTKSYTVKDLEDLKDQVRPHWQEFKNDQSKQENLLLLANQALDELEAEQ